MHIFSYVCMNMYVYTQDMKGYREWLSKINTYMYAYIYTHIHIPIQICVYIFMYLFISMYKYVCMHT